MRPAGHTEGMKIRALRCGLAAATLLLITTLALAQTTVDETWAMQPILQNPTDTGMTVCFMAKAADNVTLHWSEKGGQMNEVAMEKLVIPGTYWVNWRLRLEGLEPGAEYSYKVTCDLRFDGPSIETKQYTFKTLDANADEVRFAVFNDLHQRPAVLEALLQHVEQDDYEFAFLNGDCLEAYPSGRLQHHRGRWVPCRRWGRLL